MDALKEAERWPFEWVEHGDLRYLTLGGDRHYLIQSVGEEYGWRLEPAGRFDFSRRFRGYQLGGTTYGPLPELMRIAEAAALRCLLPTLLERMDEEAQDPTPPEAWDLPF